LSGSTPLHLASKNSHYEAVKYLVEAGAALHLKDKRGKTALDYSSLDLISNLLREKMEVARDEFIRILGGETVEDVNEKLKKLFGVAQILREKVADLMEDKEALVEKLKNRPPPTDVSTPGRSREGMRDVGMLEQKLQNLEEKYQDLNKAYRKSTREKEKLVEEQKSAKKREEELQTRLKDLIRRSEIVQIKQDVQEHGKKDGEKERIDGNNDVAYSQLMKKITILEEEERKNFEEKEKLAKELKGKNEEIKRLIGQKGNQIQYNAMKIELDETEKELDVALKQIKEKDTEIKRLKRELTDIKTEELEITPEKTRESEEEETEEEEIEEEKEKTEKADKKKSKKDKKKKKEENEESPLSPKVTWKKKSRKKKIESKQSDEKEEDEDDEKENNDEPKSARKKDKKKKDKERKSPRRKDKKSVNQKKDNEVTEQSTEKERKLPDSIDDDLIDTLLHVMENEKMGRFEKAEENDEKKQDTTSSE